MSTENPTMALVGLDQGTLNFVQAITAWDGEGAAPFTTTRIRDLARILSTQNFLEAFEAGRMAIDAVPRIQPELEDQKADSIQQQTEIARLPRSLDLPLDAASAGRPSSTGSQDIPAPDKFSGDRKTYRTLKAQLQTKLVSDARKFHDDQHEMIYIISLLEGNAH